MHEDQQRGARPASGSAPGTDHRSSVSSRFEQFEKRQRELWRWTMLVLFLLSVAYAWTSKDAVHSFAHGLESLPIWLVILVVLFASRQATSSLISSSTLSPGPNKVIAT